MTRWDLRSHSRTKTIPGGGAKRLWSALASSFEALWGASPFVLTCLSTLTVCASRNSPVPGGRFGERWPGDGRGRYRCGLYHVSGLKRDHRPLRVAAWAVAEIASIRTAVFVNLCQAGCRQERTAG
jgi:hypothetical protein